MKRICAGLLFSLVTVAGAACSSSSSSGVTAGSDDAGVSDDVATFADQCSAARTQLLGSVDAVSTGAVSTIASSGGATTLFVDATAGGETKAATRPWLYLSLATASKASVTDVTSLSSTGWDLAVKRAILYTNDGTGGPGAGGAAFVAKGFADVTAADATSAAFATEAFYDEECNSNVDQVGSVLTTFSSWYTYDESTHALAPKPGTWLVKGGDGKLYKLAILTFYSIPDGGNGNPSGGSYSMQVEAL